MDTRSMLHERHHTTLQPEVLIVGSGPGLEIRIPENVFDHSADDDPVAGLLAPDVPNSSTVDPEAGSRESEQSADVNSGSAPSSMPIRSWDEIHKKFIALPELDTLDIMRESSRIVRRQSDLFTSLTAALILPVSIVVLTHVVVTQPAIDWAEKRLEVALFEESVAAAIEAPYTKYVYLKVAEFLVTLVLCIPLAITLAAVSKAAIVHTVAATYTGLKVSFVDVIYRVVTRVWLPLVITYAAACAIFFAAGVAALLFLGLLDGIFAALHTSSAIILLVFIILAITFCGIFVFLKIMLNVADVICILEDKYGFAALARSFSILQGRVQVAFGTYMVTFFSAAFVTFLFESRVTDKNYYTEHNSSSTWEGPLLLLLHSFVYLFGDIMTTVLYFSCPKSSSFEALDASRAPEGVGYIL